MKYTANTVCTCMQIIPAETIPGMGTKGNKGEQGRGLIQVWYIWYAVRTFVNATVYPHTAKQ
jgi:hypothetical protein